MKRKILALLIIFSVLCLITEKSDGKIIPDKKINIAYKRTIVFYTWGIPKIPDKKVNECRKLIQCKYGFRYKRVAGCIVDDRDLKRWKIHNKKMEIKMKKRHGNNWHQEYLEDVKDCQNKQ